MAKSHGKGGLVQFGANDVGNVTRWTLDEQVTADDTTAQGDTAMTHIVGIPGWSGTIEGWYDPADTNGQVAATIGASLTVKFYTDTDASGKTFKTGTASVTGVNWESAKDAINSFSINVTGNGALTTSTVS